MYLDPYMYVDVTLALHVRTSMSACAIFEEHIKKFKKRSLLESHDICV